MRGLSASHGAEAGWAAMRVLLQQPDRYRSTEWVDESRYSDGEQKRSESADTWEMSIFVSVMGVIVLLSICIIYRLCVASADEPCRDETCCSCYPWNRVGRPSHKFSQLPKVEPASTRAAHPRSGLQRSWLPCTKTYAVHTGTWGAHALNNDHVNALSEMVPSSVGSLPRPAGSTASSNAIMPFRMNPLYGDDQDPAGPVAIEHGTTNPLFGELEASHDQNPIDLGPIQHGAANPLFAKLDDTADQGPVGPVAIEHGTTNPLFGEASPREHDELETKTKDCVDTSSS